jgi:hypothetical protein
MAIGAKPVRHSFPVIGIRCPEFLKVRTSLSGKRAL